MALSFAVTLKKNLNSSRSKIYSTCKVNNLISLQDNQLLKEYFLDSPFTNSTLEAFASASAEEKHVTYSAKGYSYTLLIIDEGNAKSMLSKFHCLKNDTYLNLMDKLKATK